MASSLQVLFLLSLTSGLFIAGAMSWTDEHKEEEIVQACPPGWTQFRERCFSYFSRSKTWADARKECENRGGNLASVRDHDEHVFISEHISQVSRYGEVWLGGTDSTQDNSWYWIDGSPFLYTNWDNGEPSSGGYGGGFRGGPGGGPGIRYGRRYGDCLVMNYRGASWSDVACSYYHPYICSKDAQKPCK